MVSHGSAGASFQPSCMKSSYSKPYRFLLGALVLGGMTFVGQARAAGPEETQSPLSEKHSLSLSECLDLAQRNNHRRPASQFAVAAAEAQHRQALSAYWPQLVAKGGYTISEDPPNFVFPASSFQVPSQTITTPASTAYVTVPAGVFGPTAVQLPVSVPPQQITTGASQMVIPEQKVQLLDRGLGVARAEMKWLLYDGGLRSGLREQTAGLVEAMKQASRRTDLEIADSVRRLYYGAVLARQLHQLGKDTLARMETTLSLTESQYQNGAGRVSKADFLDNKMMVESLRAMAAVLEKNEAMSQAALANTLGLGWRESISPSDTEIPLVPLTGGLEDLVGGAYRFNPDWKSYEAGLRASEGGLREARSGYAPKVALVGSLERYWTDYDAGLYTRENKKNWSIGLGFEIPIFDGNLTRAKVSEMKARLNERREQGFLLREGIGLQIKDTFLGIIAAGKACSATEAAMLAARENRELNQRAYQQEAVDTDKVIKAQLYEALMTAQHLRARYEQVSLQSLLSLNIGSEISRLLQEATKP